MLSILQKTEDGSIFSSGEDVGLTGPRNTYGCHDINNHCGGYDVSKIQSLFHSTLSVMALCHCDIQGLVVTSRKPSIVPATLRSAVQRFFIHQTKPQRRCVFRTLRRSDRCALTRLTKTRRLPNIVSVLCLHHVPAPWSGINIYVARSSRSKMVRNFCL